MFCHSDLEFCHSEKGESPPKNLKTECGGSAAEELFAEAFTIISLTSSHQAIRGEAS